MRNAEFELKVFEMIQREMNPKARGIELEMTPDDPKQLRLTSAAGVKIMIRYNGSGYRPLSGNAKRATRRREVIIFIAGRSLRGTADKPHHGAVNVLDEVIDAVAGQTIDDNCLMIPTTDGFSSFDQEKRIWIYQASFHVDTFYDSPR